MGTVKSNKVALHRQGLSFEGPVDTSTINALALEIRVYDEPYSASVSEPLPRVCRICRGSRRDAIGLSCLDCLRKDSAGLQARTSLAQARHEPQTCRPLSSRHQEESGAPAPAARPPTPSSWLEPEKPEKSMKNIGGPPGNFGGQAPALTLQPLSTPKGAWADESDDEDNVMESSFAPPRVQELRAMTNHQSSSMHSQVPGAQELQGRSSTGANQAQASRQIESVLTYMLTSPASSQPGISPGMSSSSRTGSQTGSGTTRHTIEDEDTNSSYADCSSSCSELRNRRFGSATVDNAHRRFGSAEVPMHVTLDELLSSLRHSLLQAGDVGEVSFSCKPSPSMSHEVSIAVTYEVGLQNKGASFELLTRCQRALLTAVSEQGRLLVMGHETEPFSVDVQGTCFTTTLARNPRPQERVCRDTYSQGFCPRNGKCRWAHPVASDLVSVYLVLQYTRNSVNNIHDPHLVWQ